MTKALKAFYLDLEYNDSSAHEQFVHVGTKEEVANLARGETTKITVLLEFDIEGTVAGFAERFQNILEAKLDESRNTEGGEGKQLIESLVHLGIKKGREFEKSGKEG